MILKETKEEFVFRTRKEWETNPRWKDIVRPYTPEDIWKIRGTVQLDHTLALKGSKKLWKMFDEEQYINSLGALTGNQALQMVRAGLKAIYISGWQVAADMNQAGEMYPDQSLYPADSAPNLVRRINNAFMRADQIQHMDEKYHTDFFAPLIADGEAGFGGVLNVYEFMKAMIRAGASGVHFEDQLSAYKKCGHLGGKVLISTQQFINTLISARLAADVEEVPVVLVARTDAGSASLLMGSNDPADEPFTTNQRSPEGFMNYNGCIDACISRGLSFAPYADMLWFETSKPNLEEAKIFADAIHEKYPGKYLAYNCSPSFNWSKNLEEHTIERFQKELGELGYKFQFITLAGFHQLNYGMFNLAKDYKERGMPAFTELQDKEFEAVKDGFQAVKHQSFVGTGYFDEISLIVTSGQSSTIGLKNSTEAEQFH